MNLWIDPTLIIKDKQLATDVLSLLFTLKEEGFVVAGDVSTIDASVADLIAGEELLRKIPREECPAMIDFDKSEGVYVFWVDEEIWGKGLKPSDFIEIARKGKQRKASVSRNTAETDIRVEINLDGDGSSNINTGLKFFDHMLEQIARHGLTDLSIHCDGDLEVDEHHTIEDVSIALGQAITDALGDKKGIERYAFVLPMDEASATISLDLSGRPYLVFEGEFNREYVGDMPTEMIKHFFYSLAMNLQATLHIRFDGENDHHKVESIFKGFARVLKTAVEHNPRIKGKIPSSKGTL